MSTVLRTRLSSDYSFTLSVEENDMEITSVGARLVIFYNTIHTVLLPSITEMQKLKQNSQAGD